MYRRHINQVALAAILHPFVVFVVATVVSVSLTIETQAQNSPEMSATYGRGVHAYFSNRMTQAEQLLSQVIEVGTTDPRVYYFRSMVRLQTGRQYEAEEDMKVGAAYEARDPGSRHSIGLALQRIQGSGRRTLERFRREGRLNRAGQRRKQTQLRYEQLQRREPKVLRREAPVRLEQLVDPSLDLTTPVTPPSAPPASSKVPQVAVPSTSGDGSSSNLPMATPEKAPDISPPPATETEDLFADPTPKNPSETPVVPSPEAAEAEMQEDPFGGNVSEKESVFDEEPAPAEPTPEAEEEDPFAENPAAEDKPAAESEPSEAESPEADEAEPKEESPGNEDLDDLFGNSSAKEGTSNNALAEQDAPAEETEKAAEVANSPAEGQVASGKLFGILGRVVGSTLPWRNIQLPAMDSMPAAFGRADTNSAENIALGPSPSSPNQVIPASAEKPLEATAEEDLFGADAANGPSENDPFDTADADPLEAGEEKMESEPIEVDAGTKETPADNDSKQPEDDDIFGGF